MSRPFIEMMTLEPHGPDTYIGAGPPYPWGGLYGGQVVAQALLSAQLTAKALYLPHSLHANFLRMGDPEEPVRYEVERLRDGRSFYARQVVARQSTGAILNMSASFRVAEVPTMDLQLAAMPLVPAPEEGTEVSWSPLFELRHVPGPGQRPRDDQQSAWSWFRVLEDLGERPIAHAAALAYVSDSGPASLVTSVHEQTCPPGPKWAPLSLDHAVWFHRQFRADSWLLLEAFTGSLHNSTALATGRIFSPDGALVASIAQEVLLRRPRASVGAPLG
ncbi:MAG TPA: acyl-CoA thioesterase domain-containing protein [Acidimicrobiales bacterium]|nr:acyl-CoA thioesterase domain-containing protein [Acidimicrobiales bacterium]